MSRLIDADKLLDDMKNKWDMQDLYLPIHFKELLIDAQPTAFDVDKVVEQLEDYKMWKELLIYDLNFRERQILKKAIDIVKAGGIDE